MISLKKFKKDNNKDFKIVATKRKNKYQKMQVTNI